MRSCKSFDLVICPTLNSLHARIFTRCKDVEAYISLLPEVSIKDKDAGGILEKWFEHAFTLSLSISGGSVPGITVEKCQDNNEVWKKQMANYKHVVGPIGQGQY
ncbi:hypothetical protein ACH5RR_041862 [Cinchona calisaya]|uniref:Uncharacterized protein n=1 Tax=Cinchona calisaya TaxID=153742 RepID=A0ABD2XXX0_9GENT